MDPSVDKIKGIVSKPITSLKIRTMLEKDIQSYCALYQRIFAQSPWNEIWTLDKIQVALKKVMSKKGFIGITAEYESQPVGYLTGYRLRNFPIIYTFYYLDQLFVDDRHRGVGIGKGLLSKMVCQVNTHKGYGIVLLTKTNSAAEQFYRENGFKRLFPVIRFKEKVLLYKLLQQG